MSQNLDSASGSPENQPIAVGHSTSVDKDEFTVPATPAVISPYEPEHDLPSPGRRRTRLFCFECNRDEGHLIAAENRFYYSYLIGFTFGLIFLFGPFQCQCCGARRLWRYDVLNLRYWFRDFRWGTNRRGRRRFRHD